MRQSWAGVNHHFFCWLTNLQDTSVRLVRWSFRFRSMKWSSCTNQDASATMPIVCHGLQWTFRTRTKSSTFLSSHCSTGMTQNWNLSSTSRKLVAQRYPKSLQERSPPLACGITCSTMPTSLPREDSISLSYPGLYDAKSSRNVTTSSQPVI